MDNKDELFNKIAENMDSAKSHFLAFKKAYNNQKQFNLKNVVNVI